MVQRGLLDDQDLLSDYGTNGSFNNKVLLSGYATNSSSGDDQLLPKYGASCYIFLAFSMTISDFYHYTVFQEVPYLRTITNCVDRDRRS